jgi:hypothetical protein
VRCFLIYAEQANLTVRNRSFFGRFVTEVLEEAQPVAARLFIVLELDPVLGVLILLSEASLVSAAAIKSDPLSCCDLVCGKERLWIIARRT